MSIATRRGLTMAAELRGALSRLDETGRTSWPSAGKFLAIADYLEEITVAHSQLRLELAALEEELSRRQT